MDGPAPRVPVLPRVRLALAGLSALMLLALMGVTVWDVIGRYLFDAPLSGASEMTELLLAAIVFVGLPAVCLDDGHVSVDLVTSRLSGRIDRVRLVAARLVAAAVLGVVAWRLVVHGERLAGYGERSVFLHLPIGPVAIGAGVLCGLAALAILALIGLSAHEGGTRTRGSADEGVG